MTRRGAAPATSPARQRPRFARSRRRAGAGVTMSVIFCGLASPPTNSFRMSKASSFRSFIGRPPLSPDAAGTEDQRFAQGAFFLPLSKSLKSHKATAGVVEKLDKIRQNAGEIERARWGASKARRRPSARRTGGPSSALRLDSNGGFRYSLRDRLPADDLAPYLAMRADEPPCIDIRTGAGAPMRIDTLIYGTLRWQRVR